MPRDRLGIPSASAAVVVAVLVALPAHAGTCNSSTACPTTTTVAVTAPGGLTISVPASPVSLGSSAPGTQISRQLGSTTVTDQRAQLTATWTASVSGTNFTSGANTVPNTAVLYWSGSATATTGNGTFVPGQANAAAAQSLNVSRTAFSKTTGAGDNSATWKPTIVVNIPGGAAMGTYSGTVSQSVV
ncbi:hypothetical protein [Actinoallomurus sp. CA-150999]|uniref:hypothetical protein n=1 Tax=Actinoallomurus sp. CA-150999 TaxID=3239887 RepID=UPI003D8A63A8